MSRVSASLVTLLALAAAPLAAQGKPVEFGLDAGLGFKVNDPTLVTFGIPVQSFRVGFAAGNQVSVEPRIAFNFAKPEGDDAVYTLGAELGFLYHFTAEAERSRAYVRPFAGVELFDFGVDNANQFHLGAGIGVKVPVGVQRMAVRLEAGGQYGFENDDLDKQTIVYALIGFSFFTR